MRESGALPGSLRSIQRVDGVKSCRIGCFNGSAAGLGLAPEVVEYLFTAQTVECPDYAQSYGLNKQTVLVEAQ